MTNLTTNVEALMDEVALRLYSVVESAYLLKVEGKGQVLTVADK